MSTDELAVRDAVVAELAVLRARLRGEPVDQAAAALAEARERVDGPSPLDRLADGFGLTDFERAVLLLVAGPELVAAVAQELEAAGAGPRPTFGTALALLPGAHWSALTPSAPLRRWELIHPLDPLAPVRSPLVVDERVLHHLVGAGGLDPQIAALARRVPVPGWLPPALRDAAHQVVDAWNRNRLVLVDGPQRGNALAVVAAAAADGGLELLEIAGGDLPTGPEPLDGLVRRMERETVLASVCWALDVGDLSAADGERLLRRAERSEAPVAVLGSAAATPPTATSDTVRVPRLSGRDRVDALGRALSAAGGTGAGDGEPAATVREAAAVFDLPLDALARVADDVAAGEPLWGACRRRGRVATGGLAEIVEPRAGWADLVVPPTQLHQLRALVARVRHRTRVLEDWGFGARTSRGLGSVALFSGPSGTGKTLAAEVIAHELGLDLVRVDLSQVVSKYVGETEKHLAALFDAAEDGGAVLLFDEADTLFGKRSEVRDSHDRYANIEVGYLLQRVESFRGLAVLTTNARSTLDPAFTRRIGTIVAFPYPDAALRRELWRGAFPEATPVDGIDVDRLAAVDLPGGGITAAALAAAYLAADESVPVSARQLETSTRWELAKTGRSRPGQGP